MNKPDKLVVSSLIGILLVSILLSLSFYPRLVDEAAERAQRYEDNPAWQEAVERTGTNHLMPTHFGVSGVPDSFSRISFGIAIAPAVLAVLAAVYLLLRSRMGEEKVYTSLIVVAVSGVLLVLHLLILRFSTTKDAVFDARMVHLALGVLFLVIGNVLGKLKPNFWTGIRVPATLNNPLVWRRVHRTGGFLVTGGAVFLLVASLVESGTLQLILSTPLAAALLVTVLILPRYYSRRS